MSERGRLLIICGLPGAGKSTLAKSLAERTGGIVFSPDDWMETLALDIWDLEARSRVETLQWQVARKILARGGTVVIEWGTWARQERDKLRTQARQIGSTVELHYLTASPEELHERICRRGRENPPITLEMLRDWSELFEAPTPEELALYDDPAGERD